MLHNFKKLFQFLMINDTCKTIVLNNYLKYVNNNLKKLNNYLKTEVKYLYNFTLNNYC